MQIRTVVDLTYPIHEGMITFDAPWHPKVRIEQLGRHTVEGRETRKVTFGTHTGTQIDAPLHFIAGGTSIDLVDVKCFVGPVTILDFSNLSENECLTREMLAGKSLGQRVIFRFSWGKHWNTAKFYRGYPYFSRDAARHLIDAGVLLVGFDTPSPDDSRTVLKGKILGSAEDSPIHKILLGAGIVLLEYVAHLDLLNDLAGWNIAALPLRLQGGDGSPARAVLFK